MDVFQVLLGIPQKGKEGRDPLKARNGSSFFYLLHKEEYAAGGSVLLICVLMTLCMHDFACIFLLMHGCIPLKKIGVFCFLLIQRRPVLRKEGR
jgi:hypothetical protein